MRQRRLLPFRKGSKGGAFTTRCFERGSRVDSGKGRRRRRALPSHGRRREAGACWRLDLRGTLENALREAIGAAFRANGAGEETGGKRKAKPNGRTAQEARARWRGAALIFCAGAILALSGANEAARADARATYEAAPAAR